LSDRTPAIKDLFLDHFYIIGCLPYALKPSNPDDASAVDDDNNNENKNFMEQSFLRS
jgi:hypothetical protein